MAISGAADIAVKLVVGLGNPGDEYRNSRHNAGFMVVERILADFPAGRFEPGHVAQSRIFSGRFRGRPLVFQLPQTYMNLSGLAVAGLCGRLRIAPEEVLVVVDDLDLPLGRLRLRAGGSDGGHNGLKSIAAELGSENFRRLRVGIGRPGARGVVDYVLSGFTGVEAEQFSAAVDRAAAAVKLVLSVGLSRAMNSVNARPADEDLNKVGNDNHQVVQ